MLRDIGGETCELQVHSVFDTAINFTSPHGLVTLLSPGRSLQPYAAVLKRDPDFRSFEGHSLRLCADGILTEDGKAADFTNAAKPDLRMREQDLPTGAAAEAALEMLKSFLEAYRDRGLTELTFEEHKGTYAAFLLPRFMAFRKVATGGSDGEFAEAAFQIAGCGEGLTPSSDDLLSGYLLPAGILRGREAAKQAGYRAAERTNDISAAMLKHSADGLYSEDILRMMHLFCEKAGNETIAGAVKRVARFGHSSGCDFLTGLYFGIHDLVLRKEV